MDQRGRVLLRQLRERLDGLRRLVREALADGFTHVELKVGADLAEDVSRFRSRARRVGPLLEAAAEPAAEREALEDRQPLGRLVTAEEVAEAIIDLASPAAISTTGTALAVDGAMQGLRLRPTS